MSFREEASRIVNDLAGGAPLDYSFAPKKVMKLLLKPNREDFPVAIAQIPAYYQAYREGLSVWDEMARKGVRNSEFRYFLETIQILSQRSYISGLIEVAKDTVYGKKDYAPLFIRYIPYYQSLEEVATPEEFLKACGCIVARDEEMSGWKLFAGPIITRTLPQSFPNIASEIPGEISPLSIFVPKIFSYAVEGLPSSITRPTSRKRIRRLREAGPKP